MYGSGLRPVHLRAVRGSHHQQDEHGLVGGCSENRPEWSSRLASGGHPVQRLTVEVFRNGKTVTEIARGRNLGASVGWVTW
jgi:hypothetical protein